MNTNHRLVPDDFRGVWSRVLLQTDTQATPPVSDSSAWVRWLQTSHWHGDLRVPDQALQGRAALPLAQLSPAQLGALASQQGFAGLTDFEALPEGQICTWLRRIDYQPPGLHPDAGWLVCEQPDRLIEIGVHDDYNEVWVRLPDSMGRYVALAGLGADGQDDGRRILVAGSYLMLIRGRTARWPRGMTPGYTLSDVLLSAPERALEWLDCEITFGRLHQAPQGEPGQWHIERSTLPEREGQILPCRLQRLDDTRAAVVLHDEAAASNWQVLEWTCQEDCISH